MQQGAQPSAGSGAPGGGGATGTAARRARSAPLSAADFETLPRPGAADATHRPHKHASAAAACGSRRASLRAEGFRDEPRRSFQEAWRGSLHGDDLLRGASGRQERSSAAQGRVRRRKRVRLHSFAGAAMPGDGERASRRQRLKVRGVGGSEARAAQRFEARRERRRRRAEERKWLNAFFFSDPFRAGGSNRVRSRACGWRVHSCAPRVQTRHPDCTEMPRYVANGPQHARRSQNGDTFRVEFTARRGWSADGPEDTESDSDDDPWTSAQFGGYPHFHAAGGFGGAAWAGSAHEDSSYNTWYTRAAADDHSDADGDGGGGEEWSQRVGRGAGAAQQRGGGHERLDPETRRHLGSLGLEKLPGSAPELRAAFQGAAKRFHPDMVSSGAASSERFQQARRAYQYLRAHVAA